MAYSDDLSGKCQLKVTIVIFFVKIAGEGYFQPKTEKGNTAMTICIFDSVFLPKFSLNLQLWIVGENLPKKGISALEQKN